MLLRRIAIALGAQRRVRIDETRPRVARIDDVVDVAATRGDVRMRELVAVLVDLAVRGAVWIRAVVDLFSEQNLHRALWSHHRDLRRGPRDVVVAANVLGRHDVVRAAVRLARNDRELGDRRLTVRVQQLRTVLDDAAVLLRDTWEKTRNVLKGDDRNIERVAESYETRRLERCIDVEHTREHGRLVRHDPDAVTAEMREATDDVRAVVALYLVELAIVDDATDDVVHVVWLVRIVRHHLEQFLVAPIAWIGPFALRRVVDVVRGDEAEQVADRLQARGLGIEREVRDTRRGRVRIGATELLHRHVFVRH